ncbi:MAG: helix-turn-helix transcriptional regulator [Pseudomonadota bacterium]
MFKNNTKCTTHIDKNQYITYFSRMARPSDTGSMGFGKRIKAARKAAELSQEDLASKCGYAQQASISHYENERREPTLEDFDKIAKALNVPVVTLLVADVSSTQDEETLIKQYRLLEDSQRPLVTAYIRALLDSKPKNTGPTEPMALKGIGKTFVSANEPKQQRAKQPSQKD